jgi:hypothetical protein
MLVLSAGAAALFLVRLPADHFARPRAPWGRSWGAIAKRVSKNFAGILLIVLGLLLSIPGVPGQGILTILMGLFLVDFPGKFRIERRLLRLPRIARLVNGIRNRYGRPPLEIPEDTA